MFKKNNDKKILDYKDKIKNLHKKIEKLEKQNKNHSSKSILEDESYNANHIIKEYRQLNNNHTNQNKLFSENNHTFYNKDSLPINLLTRPIYNIYPFNNFSFSDSELFQESQFLNGNDCHNTSYFHSYVNHNGNEEIKTQKIVNGTIIEKLHKKNGRIINEEINNSYIPFSE